MAAAQFFMVFTALLRIGLAQFNSNGSGSGAVERNPACLATPLDSPCRDLPGTTSPFSQPQFIPAVGGVIEIDVTEMQLLFTILQGSPDPPECVESLRYTFCLAVQPQCEESTGLPLNVCQESCEVYMWLLSSGQCEPLLQYLQFFATGSPIATISELVKLYTDFNCTNRSTYYYGELDPAEGVCANLFDPQTQERLANSTRCVPVPTGTCTVIRNSQFYVPAVGRRDDTLFQTLSELVASINTNSFCVDAVLTIACYYLFPDCNVEVGSQLVFCPSVCPSIEILKSRCSEEFNELKNSKTDFANFLTNLTCSDPDTYALPGVQIDQESCVDLQNLVDELSSNQGHGDTVIIGSLIGGIGGLVIIIVLLIIAFCITKRKTKWQVENIVNPQNIIFGGEHYELKGPAVISPVSISSPGIEFELFSDEVVICDADKEYFHVKFAGSSVTYGQLEIGEIIGEGAFGKVFKGKMLQPSGSGICVAIKTIRNLVSDEDLKDFLAESLIMKDFNHPNIVGLLAVCLDAPDGHPYIVLPFMTHGNLRNFLQSRRVHLIDVDTYPKGLGLTVLMQMCIDIAQGMEYLALNKFVHRDLATRNCMVDDNLKIKVGDFGLARDVYRSNYYRASKNAKLPVKWMPPETLHDGISNEKTDVWSFGVTCWEVFSLGRTPYPGVDNYEIIHHVSNGGRLQIPTLCTQEMYAIVERCWEIRPEERPNFQELVTLLKDYWDEEHFYVVQAFSVGGPYNIS